MRRLALLLVGSATVAWGVASAIGGCGNDDATAPTDTPDTGATSSGTASGGTSGTPPIDDAGTDTGSSPVASNPGKISCGAVECDAGNPPGPAPTVVCCIREAGASKVCSDIFNCGGGGNGALQMQCDESADCTETNNSPKCCLEGNSTQCSYSPVGQNRNCPGPGAGIQVCKTDLECGDAGACAEKTCGAGMHKVRVCGTPEGCN